jgi:hypothetical protein
MLRQLYELGISGKQEEFMAYRILYLLHTRNRSGEYLSDQKSRALRGQRLRVVTKS